MNEINQDLLNKLKEWAAENKDIYCMLIGGSQSNKSKVLDNYSDVDVVIFARNRKKYDKDLSWISRFGKLASYHEHNIGVPWISHVHKIYFTNGAHLDLLFWDRRMLRVGAAYLWLRDNTSLLRLIPDLWRKIIENHFAFFPKYVYRGYMLLADKKNYRRRMEYIAKKYKFKQTPFSQKKLQHVVSKFWAYAYSSAISIARNELMCAKLVGDNVMKFRLLELIELYVKYKHGEDYDVFDNGRYLEKWAPPFIVEKLKDVFGRYEANDAWRSLMETMDLFGLICTTFENEFPELRFDNPELHFRKLIEEIRMRSIAYSM
jgi:aminoglycoside 6-adenylyltransferase